MPFRCSLALIVAFYVLMSPVAAQVGPAPPLAAPQSPSGDLNLDQRVDVLDVQALINEVLALRLPTQAGDVNDDRQINVIDVQSCINIALSLPVISRTVPKSVRAGLPLTIHGGGFAANAADNDVRIGGVLTQVLQTIGVNGQTHALVVVVPQATPDNNLRIVIAGRSSNALALNILRPTDQTDNQLLDALANAEIHQPRLPIIEPDTLTLLGQNLFFDKLLSGNRNISCATCHHPSFGTSDALPISVGEGGLGLGSQRTPTLPEEIIHRNSPELFNRGLPAFDTMFWDGRVRHSPLSGDLRTPEPSFNGPNPASPEFTALLTDALAAQAMFPVLSHEEMRGDPGSNDLADAPDNFEVWSRIMGRLVGFNNGQSGGNQEYRDLFKASYPQVSNFDDFNFAHAARAIAAFERSAYLSLGSPLDRYLAGDFAALSDAQKRGAQVFLGPTARCSTCHRGPLLSDLRPHAVGVPQLGPGFGGEADDRGLALETGNPADNYRFRTPPLRNLRRSGPYMHDGAFTTLTAVLEHYSRATTSALNYNPGQLPVLYQPLVDTDVGRNQERVDALDPALNPPPTLGAQEIADLLEFLSALDDPTPPPAAPSSVASGLPVD